MRPLAELADELRLVDPVAGRQMLRWMAAGLAAIDPRRAVRAALVREHGTVRVGDQLHQPAAVHVLAIGKAAPAMAWGADDALGEAVVDGLVISADVSPVPSWARLVVGGHPIPDDRSRAAARDAIRFVDAVGRDDLLLALVSGGGSALMASPDPTLPFDQVREVAEQLLRSGAPIQDVNAVRTRISAVKGGRLAARCQGSVTTLAISDVVGSDPSLIASGPTVAPRPFTESVRDLFDRVGISGPAADRVAACADQRPAVQLDRPAPVAIVADGAMAAAAVVAAATGDGARAAVMSDALTGDAAQAVAEALAATAESTVGVFSGETTVHVEGHGQGGRNQHAALVAALAIRGSGTRFLACGSDGRDGPTDAAGALVDGGTVGDPDVARRHLDACDAYPYLAEAQALIRTGPTGTNVGDVWIVDRRDLGLDAGTPQPGG